MTEAIANAGAMRDAPRAPRSLIVTGERHQADFWAKRLSQTFSDPQKTTFETDNKGNFLGTLRAYHEHVTKSRAAPSTSAAIEQIVMLVGAGTRLSPFTQALGNMKSALPLPVSDYGRSGRNIGELAIQASLPIIECLRNGGFDGVVIRWGDEVQVPGNRLTSVASQFKDVDAVRFGWKTSPTDALATQKEWIIANDQGIVQRDLIRQPRERLIERLAEMGHQESLSAYVNLGSLAASHHLLEIASHVFQRDVENPEQSVNWDPAFWVAVQCADVAEWRALIEEEAARGQSSLQNLHIKNPEFFNMAQQVKLELEATMQRPMRVAVLDFGEPYWLDVGTHQSLRKAFADLLSDSRDGRIIRTLLGIPSGVGQGASFVADSYVNPHVDIENSIVLGAHIADPGSRLDGAVVLGGRYGRLLVHAGGVAIESTCKDLTIEGPHGIAFRLAAPSAIVRGFESVATIVAPGENFTLRYDDSLGSINDDSFSSAVLGNKISFQQAASLVRPD